MLVHPQTLARDMVIEVEHEALGAVKSLGSPVKLSAPEGAVGGAGAPRLGQHTTEVLRESGLSDTEVAALIRDGVAVQG
jgi:crotonobetainyl-CoA:carnitine CoA-transferase CaiB-like acyl-CoA transferase